MKKIRIGLLFLVATEQVNNNEFIDISSSNQMDF